MNTLEIELREFRPTSVDFTDTDLVVKFVDGRKIATPLDWYPRLRQASKVDRENYAITPAGIHWPTIDEDLSIAGMLKGRVAIGNTLRTLLQAARLVTIEQVDYEKQKRSFAFGNTSSDNSLITKTIIDRQAEQLGQR